jgi:hypothetical protein
MDFDGPDVAVHRDADRQMPFGRMSATEMAKIVG